MDRTMVYDMLYAIAAQGEREGALFGSYGAAAREAFVRSLVGEAIPELWFELPLLGEPWFDLHALTAYGDVAGTQATFAGHRGAYADALAWFAGQAPGTVRQFALSYDSHLGDVEHPAVQLLVNGPDPSVPQAFLGAAGRADLQAPYGEFVRAMPSGWYACYAGVFPGREAAGARAFVRVECIVGDSCQRLYASEAQALRGDLARIGLEDVDGGLVDGVQELARSSFPLELQFDVGPDGMALPVLSASVRFQPGDWSDPARMGEIGRLAGWMQARGLADGRCALLARTAFAKRLKKADESVVLSCFPAFAKLRWREGCPPDAKAYLMARAAREADPGPDHVQ